MKNLFTSLIILISLALNAQKVFYVNATSGLNYREAPRGKILGKFKHKKALEVLSFSEKTEYIEDEGNYISGSWAEVKNNGKVVYVYSGFLAKEKPVDNYGVIEYDFSLCDCINHFDKNKYSESALQKITESYINEAGNGNFFYDAIPSDIDDIEALDVNELTKQHRNHINYLNSIEINSNYWTRRIKEEIEYAKKAYEVDKIMLLAYKDPEKLNDYDVGDKASYYRSVLIEGGELMLNEWGTYIQESKRGRYNPDAYLEEYYEKRNSIRKYDYARSDLMRYRMWNTMKHPKYPDRQNDYDEFEKLFFYTNCTCDEE